MTASGFPAKSGDLSGDDQDDGRRETRSGLSGAWIAAAVGVLLLLGAGLLVLPGATDVVDRGYDLRPYPSGEVFEVRIADTVTLYFDQESDEFDGDVLSGAALVALTTIAAMTLLLLRAAAAPLRVRRFYLLTTLGLGLLAFDEMVGLHESVGHNLPFLADLPGVERPDDVVFALYFLPVIAMVVVFRDVLGSSPLARRLFLALIPLFGLAVLFDLTGSLLDEPVEMLCALTGGAGLIALMARHLMQYLGLERLRDAQGSSPS